MNHRWKGTLFGLGAAGLFGVSAPIAKRLLPDAGIVALMAAFYGAAGLAITVARVARRGLRGEGREAALGRGDVPALAVLALLGGCLGPALMLFGLSRTSGVAGALLLNLEAPFTIAIAVLLFREHLGWVEAAGAACTLAGAALLAFVPGPWRVEPGGAIAIAGACVCWAIDNNVSQQLSGKDPLAVIQVKTLAAGAGASMVALLAGQRLPGGGVLAAALIVGSLSYGVSLVLDLHALRLLGAAREAAIFATAPFVGAIVAVPLLGEPVRLGHLIAAAGMAAGLVLLVKARHAHPHVHDPIEHDHLHVHDEHHQHGHPEGDVAGPHAHAHRHDPIAHAHPHVSDVHHRHRHGPSYD